VLASHLCPHRRLEAIGWLRGAPRALVVEGPSGMRGRALALGEGGGRYPGGGRVTRRGRGVVSERLLFDFDKPGVLGS
jgi:hypothetical protein